MSRPRKKEDIPVSLHPLSFEDALKRLMKTPPVNPAKRKRQRRHKTEQEKVDTDK
jgi:hypothetical protein